MPRSRDASRSPAGSPPPQAEGSLPEKTLPEGFLPEGFLTVARITKPRGRKGEVAAHLLTDFPENLLDQKELFLWDGKAAPRAVTVEEAWLHGDRLILKFAGCDSIDEAKSFAGLEVLLPRAQAAALPEGAHYHHELVGCRVVNSNTEEELGTVREVQGSPGSFRLAVETPAGKELLIPFAEEYCRRIDTEARRIEVELPDGLLDLNK